MKRLTLSRLFLKALITIEIAMMGVFGVIPVPTLIQALDFRIPELARIVPFTAPSALANIPTTLGYQGRLKNGSGTALTGTYSFIFRVYATSTGGSPIWFETQSVVVDSGYFAVQLGSVTPFVMDMNQPLYLTTEVSSDGEMSPRVPINAVSYAYTAGGVNAFAAEPTSASGGRMYYNTASGNIYYYDAIASIWRQLTSSSTAGVSDTLQSVINQGATVTTTPTFYGGIVTSNITATGTSALGPLVFGNATGASLDLGNLNVTGTTNLTGAFTFVNGTGTTIFTTNAAFTNATATNLFATNFSTINFNPTNITWTNATGTNTTSTNLAVTGLTTLADVTWQDATATTLTLTGAFAAGSSTVTTLNFTNASGSALNLSGPFAFGGATGTSLAVNSFLVGGNTVCLTNGVNCPPGATADLNWTYDVATDVVRNATATTDIVIGGAATTSAPVYFSLTGTSASTNRFILGQNQNLDVVIGGVTSTAANSQFQFSGDDLFVYGNIGIASTVYSNSGFVAGATTFYGDNIVRFSSTGTLQSLTNAIVLAPASNEVLPPTDLQVSLGRFDLRFHANLGNVTSTNSTSTNFFATNASITNLSTSNFNPTNLLWVNATGTNTTSTNLYAANLLWNGATGTNLLITGSASTSQLSVGGYAVCLSNGTNCPSGIVESDTLASVTQRGATATTTVTLFGGLLTSSLTATGSYSFVDGVERNATSVNIATTNLTVTGTSNLNLVTWNGATGTNLYVSNTLGAATGSFTNLTATNALFTNTTSTNANLTNLIVSGLTTLQNTTFTNATGTTLSLTGSLSAASTTVTTLNFTNATGSNIFVTNSVFGSTTATNAFYTNLTATNFNVTNFTPTNIT
ncbi:MAG TPA: hypothetical protein VN397_01805, partial [Candidatus Methylomirabilis sp.]|nr:hypothetical protein [Candidatus Methylomirabilis sp.]